MKVRNQVMMSPEKARSSNRCKKGRNHASDWQEAGGHTGGCV